MLHGLLPDPEAEIDALVREGKLEEAAARCEGLAEECYAEEARCDQAGDFADGMKASREADDWLKRAKRIRASKAKE